MRNATSLCRYDGSRCLAVSLACTKKPEQEIVTTPKPSGPPSSIGGTVRYRTDREVIEITGLEVSLKRGNERVGTATTDEFGTFHFDGMEPGTYIACWSGNGWESGCTEPLDVKQNGNVIYAQQILPRPTTPSAVVYGNVRLADGVLPRLGDTDKVEVLDTAGNVLASAPTNANGEYITPAAPGAAKAQVSAGAAKAESAPLAATAQAPAPPLGTAGPKRLNIIIPNRHPEVSSIEVLKGNQRATTVVPGETITLHPRTSDPERDHLTYKWVVPPGAGTITSNPDGSASWTLPNYKVRTSAYLEVDDGKGGTTQRELSLSVGAPTAGTTVTCPITGCQSLPLANVPPPAGYSAGPPQVAKFLSKKGLTDNSTAYYAAVDPNNIRVTVRGGRTRDSTRQPERAESRPHT